MIHPTEPIVSIPSRRPDDVELSLVFDPAGPLAAVDLLLDTPAPIPANDAASYLAILDGAIARLQVYRLDYARASGHDGCHP